MMDEETTPRREHPNTYIVQDRANQDEMHRLWIQDQMVTAGMGGALPEQTDPTIFGRILDVGCGAGGWLIEVARTYPTAKQLLGVDASGNVLDYAREQAKIQQVSERIEFLAMDALLMLEFPTGYFDLVNHRFAVSWLRTWDWPKLLSEYRRLLRPGGVVRVSEVNSYLECSSPALDQLNQLFIEAFYNAGHYFTLELDSMTSYLTRALQQHGVQNVRTHFCTIEYRAGTPEGLHFVEDMRLAYRTALPFLQKWTKVPDDYEAIYQQAVREMQQPDFLAKWHMLTAWGTTPDRADTREFLQVR